MAHFTLSIDPAGGPLLTVMIGVSVPRALALQQAGQTVPVGVRLRALIDTGASNTCVDPSVVQQLGIPPSGFASVITPSTGPVPQVVKQYDVGLAIYSADPTHLPLHIPTLAVSENVLSHQGFRALIGRDILRDCILVYNGTMGFFTLAF